VSNAAAARRVPAVRPTYQASAAKPSEARFRPLQAVVGRRDMRLQMAQTAKAEATAWLSLRGLPSPASRVERARGMPAGCTAEKTSGERNVCWWRGPLGETRHHRKALQPMLAGQNDLAPMDARGGQPDQPERRQAIWQPRYNHLHLGGPVRARQAQNELNSRRNAIPAASLRSLQPRRTTAQTTLQPAPAITLPPRDIAVGSLAITPPVAQTAEADATGCDLDSRRRSPKRAAAGEDPLPLGPANVPGLSSAGRAKRDPRLLQAFVGQPRPQRSP
jgi:hypothetical protein